MYNINQLQYFIFYIGNIYRYTVTHNLKATTDFQPTTTSGYRVVPIIVVISRATLIVPVRLSIGCFRISLSQPSNELARC